MALRPCRDEPRPEWIPGITPYDGRPLTVSRLIPGSYAAYAQLLHAIHLAPGVVSIESLRREDRVSEAREAGDRMFGKLGVTLPADAVSRSRTGSSIGEGRRIRWSDLAESLGGTLNTPASFERDLWDRFPGDWPDELDGPAEGSLTLAECEALVPILSEFTSGDVTYWYTWAGTQDWTGRCDRGSVADVLQYFRMDEVDASPEFWGPESRDWIVHTDVDCSFTLIGGPRPLVDAVLAHPELECIEVEPTALLATG